MRIIVYATNDAGKPPSRCVNLSTLKAQIRVQARQLRQHTLTVYYAARDPRTPFLVWLLAVLVAAYALSPIDLILDFIPVIGYLDDLILVPLGMALVLRLLPAEVKAAAQQQAAHAASRPYNWTGSRVAAAVIVLVWLLVAGFGLRWALHATGVL